MSILVVGSVAIDSVKTPFGRRDNILGGSATFFSMAASFFNKVDLIAIVGEDFPDKYIKLFKKKGVGIEGLRIAKGNTFRWKGYYGQDLSNAHTIYTHLNVFSDFDPIVPPGLRDTEYVFLANIDPDLQSRVLRQMKRPKLVACDSMNYWIQTKKRSLTKLLKDIDILLFNEGEARLFTGESNLMKAARAIIAMGPKAVIVKKGEHGVAYFSKEAYFAAPAFILDEIYDPTGAGDSFAGGMMGHLSSAGIINDLSIRKSMIYGNILASFAVQDFSVDRLLRVSKADIEKRYKDFRRITEF